MTFNFFARRALSLAFSAALLAPGLSVPARADEGMWTFSNPPRAEIKRRYGFDVTDDFLRRLQQASVRVGSGGSASFVSSNGLVLTNHHVASDIIAKLSTAEKDLMKTGFHAKSYGEELKSPDSALDVLQSIEDVTNQVIAAVKPGMSAGDAASARRAAIADIEKKSKDASGLKSEVVTLYQGGQYNLYRYKTYTDVRLVFAPEFNIAFFGGDPDNFNFPRYNLDMTLLRVYENDKPAVTPNYLKFSKEGTKAGELVFTSGHPGSTERLNTIEHLSYLRDTGIPLLLRYLERQQKLLTDFGKGDAEKARRAQDELFSIENSLKAFRGRIQGLRDERAMNRKIKYESDLRAKINADATMRAEYGDAFDAIAKGRKDLASYEKERRFLEGWGFNTRYFQIARTILRAADERAKPNAERLPEYSDARREGLEQQLFSAAPIYDDLERLKLTDSLAFMQQELGATNPLVQKVLNGKTPQARADELISGTKLKDVAARRALYTGGGEAITSANDPMIEVARMVDADARRLRKRYEDEVISVERTAYGKVARAIFANEGDKVYPDATFTLRLSYGAVKGYEENGKRVEPYTNIGGTYERAAKFNNKEPYNLPASWTAKKSALNLKTPFNFISTNDIIGGNSGSPVVNVRGELVGLIFDGNIQSLPGAYYYDDTQNRSVSVDVRAIIEAMRNVYGATALVNELLGDAQTMKATAAGNDASINNASAAQTQPAGTRCTPVKNKK